MNLPEGDPKKIEYRRPMDELIMNMHRPSRQPTYDKTKAIVGAMPDSLLEQMFRLSRYSSAPRPIRMILDDFLMKNLDDDRWFDLAKKAMHNNMDRN
jgi:hypothetical protein